MTTTATPTMPGPATSFDRDRDRVPLDDNAQALIDARLETIERMLFGQTPRADRLAIVREVESQIYELLAQRDPSDTDRDAVIAALGRLDPPEAYLPDEVGEVPRTARPLERFAHPGRNRAQRAPALPPSSATVIGKTGGILGIVAVFLLCPAALLLYLAYEGSSELPIWGFASLCLLIVLLSTLAIVLSAVDRLRGPWPIVGLTAGIIALLLGLAGAMFLAFEFLA